MLGKKHILAFVVCVLTVSMLWAVPVERRRFMATLTDGSVVMLTSCGDENLSYFLTDEGFVAELTDSGFCLTGYTHEAYLALHEPQVAVRKAKHRIGTLESSLIGSLGTKHVAVILVQFKDKHFTVASDSAAVNLYYQRYCNGKPGTSPYTGHGSSGAVSEYFRDQSSELFNPVFDVIGPVTLDSVYSFYGKDSGSSKDVNYNAFVSESLNKACQIKTDWAQLDNNGDGKVDMVFLLYAGLGQNYTNSYGDKNTIWPQERPSSYRVGNVSFAGCSSTCELRPAGASGGVITSTAPDGIGVFCHEFSHALGLPDFYDTNNRAFGMDYWSLMDYGQYAAYGCTPVGYTAYERAFMLWQPLEELKEPCTLRIPCFAKGGHGYKIVNDANSNEYYVLENRQDFGWDRLCRTRGHGLMVTHVDYDRSIWVNNKVNTDMSHQCMTIIPANNSLRGGNTPGISSEEWTQSLRGNLYPGTTGNHELTDYSVPASVVYMGGLMHKPLYDIEETKDQLIVLKFSPLGTLEQVQDLAVTDATETELTLAWNPVEDAEAYNIKVTDEMGQTEQQIDSIALNIYKVGKLQPRSTYGISVQAISDKYRNSVWTEVVQFCPADCADWLSASHVVKTEQLKVYDMNGVMVTECKAGQVGQLNVPGGVYVIKSGNGKVWKTVIRG